VTKKVKPVKPPRAVKPPPAVKPMTPGVSRGARLRAHLVGLVVSLGLVGVAMRAWALQIDDGARYRALADRQHAMHLDLPGPRGAVLDAHGRPLAISADADSIWANPHEVRDVAATAEKLAAMIGGDPGALEAKLAGDHRFVWLDRHVTSELAHAVADAKLPGIEVAKEPRRWYPGRAVAGPVIGRADIDGKGVDGIELAMNDMLAGKRSAIAGLRDARGRTMLADGIAPVEAGATVHLTLDRSIQAIAEDALAQAVAINKPKAGVVVVLEVGTGHVLAMASYPTYDPNSGDSHGARNLPVTDAFEAGSVMKVFSVAAALDDGVVTPDTDFAIGGVLMVGNRPIHDVHATAELTTSGIIKRSSNVGAAKIALRLGADKLYAGLRQFGFGGKTGIELPGERVGMLRNGSKWRDIDLAHIAFGYGLTVTPLQVAAALAAIGNGGVYVEPRIVESVVDGDTVLYRGEGASHRAISERTAAQMMKMLISVFDKTKPGIGNEGGTAKGIDVPGFKCAGKTGTAHKYDPATKKYAETKYMASFAGLAPADHPRLAIVVQIDEPSGIDYYGGDVAGPAFATVASEALRYLGVPGDPLAPPAVVPPHPIAVPRPAPAIALAPVIEPPPDPDAVAIPDFAGMGVGRALELARTLHLPVDIVGSGRVVAQDPPAGPAVNANRLVLRFSDETQVSH
jgi:cell division protein FtsI (penicillin-binding protein 3)